MFFFFTDDFACRFDLGSHSISHMVIGVTSQYSTKAMLKEVSDFEHRQS